MSWSSKALRSCDALTFANVGTSESARQAILLDAAALNPGNYAFDGYTADMTDGAETTVTVTVRIYDAVSSGNRVYTDKPIFAANGESAGQSGLRKPFNRSGVLGLWATCEASSGSDTDITLMVDVAPVIIT